MGTTEVVIYILILATVIFLSWRTGFWKRQNFKPTPTPTPEPETDLDVTTSTDDKIVLLLDKLITEQRTTVGVLHRIRGHLVFFSVAIILGIILGFFVLPIFRM